MSKYTPFKQAADKLRTGYQEGGYGKLKSSHAHEVVAAAYGFNSQAALKADEFQLYPDDPESYPDPDITSINTRMGRLGINQQFSHDAAEIISEAVTPACNFCNRQIPTQPVILSNPQKWICISCCHISDHVGSCWCCGDDYVYDATQLNHAGECPEHAGESEPYDDEEAEDRASYADYWQTHDPI